MLYLTLFMPISVASITNNSSNQSNQYSNISMPILGKVVGWPELTSSLNNNNLVPTRIILNNSNKTTLWSNNKTTNSTANEFLKSILNYETLTYYVDFEQGIILNQPAKIIQTEDLYMPLTTSVNTETFRDGSASLTVSFDETNSSLIVKADFKYENISLIGLTSFCEMRENATGNWDSQFMEFEDSYVTTIFNDNSFMYEITCQDAQKNVSLSAMGIYEHNKFSENKTTSLNQPAKFDLGNTSEITIVEDLYKNLTTNFENKTKKFPEENNSLIKEKNETRLSFNYEFDNGDVILSSSYLDSKGNSLVGLNSFCELRENSTGQWSSPYYMFYDETSKEYQTILPAPTSFWTQISCFTNDKNEENLSTINIVEVSQTGIFETPLFKQFEGISTAKSFSSGNSYGVFNLQTPNGEITDFTVDENLTIAFRIANLTLGQNLTVNLTLPIKIPQSQHLYIWKTIGDEFIQVPYEISKDRKKLTLHLQDGIIDDDGIANGIIEDPFQLILTGESTEVTTTSSQSALIALESTRLDVVINKGELGEVLVVDPRNVPETPLPPRSFVTNLLKLNISGFDGEGVDVTFHLEDSFDNPVVWKFNSRTNEWYIMPHTIINETSLSIHIIDGGLGDDDGIKNGIILDDVGIVNTEENFTEGSETDVYYNTTYGALMLNNTLSGTYYSEIIGSTTSSLWQNFTWITGGYYNVDLPDDAQSETGIGGVDMSSNIVLYHFDESSGTLVDSSGNSLSGTSSGTVTYSAEGIFDKGIYLDGSGSHLETSSNDLLNLSETLSLEMWFYMNVSPTSFGEDLYLIDRYTSSAGYALLADSNLGTDVVGFYLANSTTNRLRSTTTLNLGEWYYVVGTYNGTQMKLYLNGELENALNVTEAYLPYDADLYVGASSSIGSGPFNGTIDELAIYNKELSTEEVLTHYKRGILKLNGSVRSCDDSSCVGDSWVELTGENYQTLSLPNNPYFQYSFTFNTTNITYSPLLYNTTVNYLPLLPPNVTKFDGLTTDFTIEADLANVSNVILEDSNYGLINWINNLLVAQADFDTYVNITNNSIVVDSSNLDSSINSPANITLYNIPWPHPIIYRNGIECTTCNSIEKHGTNFTFNVTGFSNYTLGIGTELYIEDDTSEGSILINENNNFRANYTDKSTGLPLSGDGVYCEYSDNSSGSWSTPVNMTFQGTIYTYSKSFSTEGNYLFNVSCYNNISYSNLSLTDGFVIYSSYPDYSGAYFRNRTETIRRNFSLGTYENIIVSSSTHDLELNDSLEGTFTSEIFDVGSLHVWNGIDVLLRSIYGNELPDNKENETSKGGVDMSSNVALYHLDETSGVLVDSSGNSNSGYIDGAGATYGTSGIFDKSLSLDGVYTFFTVSNSASINVDETFSLEMWLRLNASPTSTGVTQYLIDRFTTASGGYGLSLTIESYLGGDKLAFYLGSGATTILYSEDNLTLGDWHHVFATYDGNEMKLYLDGVLNSNKTASNAYTAFDDDLYIGAPSSAGSNSFNGSMDEIAIYDSTLDSDEVLERYERGILDLNLEARSCDDALCVGDSWIDFENNASVDLDIDAQQYFQYRFNFTSMELNHTAKLVNLTINYTKQLAIYDTFSGETTDFNNYVTPDSVSGAILEIPEFGKIIWNNPINIISQDFDTNVNISKNYIFVNSSALDSSINTSANITLRNISLVYPIIYRNGVLCSSCTIYDYSNNDLSFTVSSFSNYTSAEGTNLSIYDDTDNLLIRVDEQLTFYANYTNITSASSINGTNTYCEFRENSSGSFVLEGNMTFNTTTGLYEYNKTFSSNGTFTFNVSCFNDLGYANLSSVDTFDVAPPPDVELYIQNVTYSNNNPVEDEVIDISLNITNAGGADANNFTVLMNVSYWNGTDKNYFATNISSVMNLTATNSTIINFTWNSTVGLTIFDFYVDNENNITELSEDNNTFTKNISVNAWMIFNGNMTSNVVLGDSNNDVMLNWTATPWGAMLVADSDSNYLVSDLVALNSTGDLSEVDIALGMVGFNDSVSNLFDSNNDGDSDSTTTINLMGTNITEVPAYSLGGSSFVTGILYDSGDGVGYDGSQDLVFVVEVNSTGVGANGAVDYEVYVPALLRSLVAGTDELTYQVSFD